MQRYFIPKEEWQEDQIVITGDHAHHILRVMRNAVGDEIICTHPNGKAAICKVTEITQDAVRVKVLSYLTNDAELPVQVTIAQAIPKGNKLELIFQKGTELGAHRFYLFQADRSVAKWDDKKASQRLKRYEKIIEEASRQCHRNIVPEAEGVFPLEEVLQQKNNFDHLLFAYEEEAKTEQFSSFGDSMKKIAPDDTVLLFIGPEGGFSPREVDMLKENNCIPVRLGKRILRTETAALYALASFSYHFEELRCK